MNSGHGDVIAQAWIDSETAYLPTNIYIIWFFKVDVGECTLHGSYGNGGVSEWTWKCCRCICFVALKLCKNHSLELAGLVGVMCVFAGKQVAVNFHQLKTPETSNPVALKENCTFLGFPIRNQFLKISFNNSGGVGRLAPSFYQEFQDCDPFWGMLKWHDPFQTVGRPPKFLVICRL